MVGEVLGLGLVGVGFGWAVGSEPASPFVAAVGSLVAAAEMLPFVERSIGRSLLGILLPILGCNLFRRC